MTDILFYSIGILQYILYAYLILWGLYIVIKVGYSENPKAIITQPIFGAFQVGERKGLINICIQLLLLGSLCLSILEYAQSGTNFMLLPLPQLL